MDRIKDQKDNIIKLLFKQNIVVGPPPQWEKSVETNIEKIKKVEENASSIYV